MSTSVDFLEFVCERIDPKYAVRYKKMFGEYMVYVNDKPIFLVCNSTVYVKMLEPLRDIMKGAEIGVPYAGSKEHYILDVENAELTSAVVDILEPITPLPKPRKKS